MKTAFCKFFLLVALLLSLTACGFHLRGHEPLPPQLQTLFLRSHNPYGSFTKQLQQILKSAGVLLVQSPQAAPVTLQILAENSGQQMTGQGVSGQLAMYILSASASYELLDAQGRMLQPPQTVSTTHSFSINSNQVLGDTTVQNQLQQEMERDLVNQLLNRLRARGTVLLLK